jgi:poly(A) polymerase
MVTLPAASWRDRSGLAELAAVLGANRGGARFVGGAVRDTLLGLDVADVDLATRHPPEQVLALLREAGIKGVPTGLAHGTITAVLPSGPVEVTTLRRDVATDGRHAIVAFTDDWREDAARRDFTINALFADPLTGEVFDYFGGLDDLPARRIRFIGDPRQRIAEDHLRILRFFRFLARFGDEPDASALEACTARANDLMALSRERIRDEMLKLLVARDAPKVLALMLRQGILLPVLPEITSADPLTRLAAREAEAGVTPHPLRRLAVLLAPAEVDTVAARLKLSNAERKRLVAMIVPVTSERVDELVYRSGQEGAVDRLLLSDRPIADVALALTTIAPAFPITGGMLVERGLRRGPDVARTLRAIEDRWIAAEFPADLDPIVAAELAQALRATSNS